MKIEKSLGKCRDCKIKFDNLASAHYHKLDNPKHKVRVVPTINKRDIIDMAIFMVVYMVAIIFIMEYILYPMLVADKAHIISCSLFDNFFEPCQYTEEYKHAIGLGGKVNA